MRFNRSSTNRFSTSIWPGYVDAVTSLLMVIMFALTIAMVAQAVLRERIDSQDSELDQLGLQISQIAQALSASEAREAALDRDLAAERDRLAAAAAEIARTRDEIDARAEEARLAAARREADKFDRAFWSGEPLDDLFDTIGDTPRTAPERIFAAGMGEWRRSHRDDGGLIAGAVSRIDRAMNVAIGREGDRLNAGLPFLATVGSTAPFIGLFGTVWGIKNAFEEIAVSQNTSLAVVAPGIAEALVATALGLLAAIPAVIFYNKLSGDADRLTGNHEAFADEFSTILSRQLDEA